MTSAENKNQNSFTAAEEIVSVIQDVLAEKTRLILRVVGKTEQTHLDLVSKLQSLATSENPLMLSEISDTSEITSPTSPDQQSLLFIPQNVYIEATNNPNILNKLSSYVVVVEDSLVPTRRGVSGWIYGDAVQTPGVNLEYEIY